MTKILAMSDIHGHLPNPDNFPVSDLILIAGDIAPFVNANLQLAWFDHKFRNWLNAVQVPVIGIAGNHDLCIQLLPDQFKDLKMN